MHDARPIDPTVVVISRGCGFRTPRLLAHDWRERPPEAEDLAVVVARMMTPAVTRSLPTSWRGDFSTERARRWITERDRETTNLVVVDRASGQTIGLMFLFESAPENSASVDVRLGYLLAEPAWGLGHATELVGGFVDWSRSQANIRSIVGGVEPGNEQSAAVLLKNGFVALEDGETYELALGPDRRT